MLKDIVCLECGSTNAEIKFPGVGKCSTCGAYFDLEELPTKVEKIRHKLHPLEEDDEES